MDQRGKRKPKVRRADRAPTAGERPGAHIDWMPLVGARNRRGQMKLLMLLADVAGFGVAAGVVLVLNLFLHFFVMAMLDLKYAVVPAFCVVLFIYSKLYTGVGLNPAEEIKLVAQYVTTAFVGGWIVLGWLETRWIPNHIAFPALWALSILGVLLVRWTVRIVAVKLGLWGEPVVVMGGREAVDRTIRYFMERGRLGYVPVMAVLDSTEGRPLSLPLPVIERSEILKSDRGRFSREGIQTLMVDVPAISEFFRSEEAKSLFLLFRRIILVSDLNWIDGASMQIHDFEGIVGITAQKGVLTPTAAFVKRSIDIVVATVTGVVLLPVMLAVAVWIKLDSPGPVFYDHERLAKDRRKTRRPGEHRRKVRIYKFRTMFINAQSALKVYLEEQAEARSEWEASQKLHNDPRVTRAGRFLRKFSLDELPQLLNVIKGEMSLVGPRPIVDAEGPHYGAGLEMYSSVRPGMTGLWQVSGRSQTSYENRVQFDTYYVRNWSVWLDIYILLRTAWLVLAKEGAY